MPLYYFNLINGDVTLDEEGQDLPDAEQLEDAGLRNNRPSRHPDIARKWTSRPPASECGLAMLRLSENVLVTTPDPDRIGQQPPAFPGNR